MATWKKVIVSGSNISELYNDANYLSTQGGGIVSSSAQIDHDTTTNFVSNEHIDHSTVSITSGNGLTGGGDITTSRTIAVGAGTHITVNADDVAVNTTTLVPAISGSILATITGGDVVVNALGLATIQNASIDAAMFSAGAATSISGAFASTSSSLATRVGILEASDFTYDLDFAGNTGTGAITDAESFAITGSAGITVTAAGNGVDVKLANLNSFTTANLSENTNLYYTDARVKSKLNTEGVISGSAQVSLASAAGSVTLGTQTVGSYVQTLGTLTGLSTTGNSGEGATPTLAVTYGALANTAVQGNTAITYSGAANEITIDGGSTITLGSGGTVTLGLADTIGGNRTFSGNVVVSGDLTVNGATTTISTTNLEVEDRFIFLNAGSGSLSPIGEGGIIVESGSAGSGTAFFYDASAGNRWAVANNVGKNATSATATAFMSTVFVGATAAATAANYLYPGNIVVQGGNIWIADDAAAI